MLRKTFLTIIIIVIFTPINLFSKPMSYWDHFRENPEDSAMYEILLASRFIMILGDYSKDLNNGPGISIEVLRSKNRWRQGIELGYYEISGSDSNNSDGNSIHSFAMSPIIFTLGYEILKFNNFNIVPYLALGAGSSMSSFSEDNGSDNEHTYFTLFEGLGIDASFHFWHITFRSGLSYCLFFPFKDSMSIGQMLRFNISAGYRF